MAVEKHQLNVTRSKRFQWLKQVAWHKGSIVDFVANTLNLSSVILPQSLVTIERSMWFRTVAKTVTIWFNAPLRHYRLYQTQTLFWNAIHPKLANGASHTCVTHERNRKAQNQPLQLLVTIERNMQFWVVVKTAAGRLGILLCVIVDGTKHRLRISTLHIWMRHQCTRGKILVRLYPLHQIAHIALTTAALTVAMGTLWVVRLWWGVVGESTTRRVWLNRRQLEDNEKNKLQFCSFRMCRNRFCNFVLAVKRH